MTLNLLLDSDLGRQKNGNQVSHDLTINFNPPIYLDDQKSYKAALNKLVTMSYSWYNMAEPYDNNKIRWRKKSEDWQTLTFPVGCIVTLTLTVFFRPTSVGWIRETKTVNIFLLCISI